MFSFDKGFSGNLVTKILQYLKWVLYTPSEGLSPSDGVYNAGSGFLSFNDLHSGIKGLSLKIVRNQLN